MLGGIGPMELIIVLVIALVVLGPKRLPDAGKSLGRGIREFKGAISGSGDDDDVERELQALASSPGERRADERPGSVAAR
jgi:sec-independent protein translocase protein TatA